MKKALFIDRDGTLVIEPPVDYQLDSFHKLEFYPKVFRNLGFIRSKLDFEFVMVTNQDGLGTSSFPEDTFWPVHNLVLKTLEGEGIIFDDILIDRSFPEDHVSTRKPGTGMMGKYLTGDYDLANSFVIGDRATDVELARNMGCKAILLQENMDILKEKNLESYCVLATTDWDKVAEFLFAGERIAEVRRTTKETDIYISLNLDGSGKCDISTGIGFLDAISTTPRALAQFLAHFFKRHGQQFCKRNTANQRVNNIQIAFVSCVGGSLKERFLPLEPVFRVLFKVSLVAFFYAILELLLDALRFSHDILLNAALWHR